MAQTWAMRFLLVVVHRTLATSCDVGHVHTSALSAKFCADPVVGAFVVDEDVAKQGTCDGDAAAAEIL